jgi:curli production assembly/transport component CsgG
MKKIIIILTVLLLSGCSAFGPLTPIKFNENEAEVLPPPKPKQEIPPPHNGKIVVALYSFKDLTGQRKQQTGVASFSTAVTQGGEGLLIKALQDAGNGEWFRVVERVGLDNLLKERQLIRSARDEAKDPSNIRPILYAGMILEGSIVSYDTNIRTGGFGWRWLGIGPSTAYNEDVVTISLRVVSTQTGEVLLTTNVRKTLLSYQVSVATFKFFDEGTKAFENEIGMSSTEVGVYVLKSAIEKAVDEMILDGEKKGLWKFKSKIEIQPVVEFKPEVKELPIVIAEPKVVKEKIEIKPEVMYFKDTTKVYFTKSDLQSNKLGPWKAFNKDTEVTVVSTEYNDVVEVTLKDEKKAYVKKDKLKKEKN